MKLRPLFGWAILLLMVVVVLVLLFVESFREGARPDWLALGSMTFCGAMAARQIINLLGR